MHSDDQESTLNPYEAPRQASKQPHASSAVETGPATYRQAIRKAVGISTRYSLMIFVPIAILLFVFLLAISIRNGDLFEIDKTSFGLEFPRWGIIVLLPVFMLCVAVFYATIVAIMLGIGNHFIQSINRRSRNSAK